MIDVDRALPSVRAGPFADRLLVNGRQILPDETEDALLVNPKARRLEPQAP
jgi:hypothetical protein